MAEEAHPRSPHITYRELWKQFKADVYGKEVQSAATYSYMWMADQMGHVCVGILVNQITTYGARYLGWYYANAAGLFAAIAIVAAWETSTYLSSVRSATGLFPLGRELLRDNAIIATSYMALGAALGFGFHVDIPWLADVAAHFDIPWVADVAAVGLTFLVICTVAAILLAPSWLRQKIIWQKAALPYLARLADIKATMSKDAAKNLQALVDKGAPSPTAKPCQIIIGGPVGSGRTQLAVGIGTEFAFKNAKTRYVSIQSLLEFASAATPAFPFHDDLGPANVGYWRWSEAQVIIIDDIGPLIAPRRDQQTAIRHHFQGILDHELKPIAKELAKRHTVWVIGDLGPPGSTLLAGEALNDIATDITTYCRCADPLVVEPNPLVIELKSISAAEAGTAGAGVASAAVASAAVTAVASVAAAGGARFEAHARYVSMNRSDASVVTLKTSAGRNSSPAADR
jgi:hypothetical protein